MVHGPQKFTDNQDLLFRTTEAFVIGDTKVPSNYVFEGKANVFDNKVYFVVKSIHSIPVKAENFHEETPGLNITPDLQLGKGYFLSDGLPVTFGIHM